MKILVIEDDPTVGKFVKRGLEEQRYSVDLVTDGEEGERLALTQPYDLILLDLRLRVGPESTFCATSGPAGLRNRCSC